MFSKTSMQQTRMLLAARSRLAATSQSALMASANRSFAHSADNFLSGSNANYIDYMYAQWQQDPSSVHASWNAYFSGDGDSFSTPPTLGKQAGGASEMAQILAALQSSTGAGSNSRQADELVRVQMLLRAFMTHGHLVADIDPLQLKEHYKDSPSLAKKFHFPDERLKSLLDPAHYGFTEADMDREFNIQMPFGSTIV